MSKLKRLILPIIFIILLISGCNGSENTDTASRGSSKENSMIFEINEKDLVKVSDEQALEYFNENKSDFIAVANYLLENESEFGTRPIYLYEDRNIEKIQDQRIKEKAELIFQNGIIKSIYSLDDEIKNVYFSIDKEYQVFEQGIRYVSDREVIDRDKTQYNYVKRYEDLGDGWFYYLHHYNRVKDEDVFREIAWSKLTEEDKKTILPGSIKVSPTT